MRKTVVPILAVAGFAAAVALAATGEAEKSFSPAPDMPSEWFWFESPEQAALCKPLIGKPAPKLEVTKWFQNEVKPEDMKGKVVILDFWATWCAPCKEAMPHGDELAKKYAGKVVYAAICSDGTEKLVPEFIKAKKLSLPMAWDEDGKLNAYYNKNGMFPTYVAIDKKGVVRAIGFSSDSVEKVIEKLVAE